MRIFGIDISRVKQTPTPTQPLVSLGDRGNWWWPIIREPFTGAWQQNMELRTDSLLTFYAIYRCITLISQDVAKMRVKLVQQDSNGIWQEFESPAFSPVLRKPNRFQTRIQFFEHWVGSKLIHGNTYVLKARDARDVVVAMYVLDPTRTKVLVAPDGDVFYQLYRDDLSNVPDDNVVVPASEIIHDRYKPLYHPLCGVSPIAAGALSGMLGQSIQRNSNLFFQNGSRPSGILSAPGAINDEIAKRLKDHWENNYSGVNVGKVAVLGDGLKFEPMRETAVDAQLAEQLKLTAEMVCTVFGVPPYMIGVGPPPNYNNIEALSQQYYSQCLQSLLESIELLLDEGLGLDQQVGRRYGTEFDLDGLIRLDTATKTKAASDSVSAGIMSPNEARSKFDLPPVEGGQTPYLQQQNFSLEALNARDQLAMEQAAAAPLLPSPPASPAPPTDDEDEPEDEEETARAFLSMVEKALQDAA